MLSQLNLCHKAIHKTAFKSLETYGSGINTTVLFGFIKGILYIIFETQTQKTYRANHKLGKAKKWITFSFTLTVTQGFLWPPGGFQMLCS